MKKTDLFTLLQLGPLSEGEIIFRHNDQYVVGKLSRIEYTVESNGQATFKLEGLATK